MHRYTYALTAFPNQAVAATKFCLEIEAAALPTPIGVTEQDTDCFVDFPAELSAGDKTTLDGLVAAHDGVLEARTRFIAPSKLIELPHAVTQDQTWEMLGGTVTTPGAFVVDPNTEFGRIIGRYKTSGSGAELRVVETDQATETDVVLMSTPHSLPDSAGAWKFFAFSTTTPPRGGTAEFRLEGRLNGATSFDLRFVSMSLLELV